MKKHGTYRLRHDNEGRRGSESYRGQPLCATRCSARNRFHPRERITLGLTLPDAVSTLEQQVRRVYRNIMRKQIARSYVGLAALRIATKCSSTAS